MSYIKCFPGIYVYLRGVWFSMSSLAPDILNLPTDLLPDIIDSMFPANLLTFERVQDNQRFCFVHLKLFRDIVFNTIIFKFLNAQMRSKCLEGLDSLIGYLDRCPAKTCDTLTSRKRPMKRLMPKLSLVTAHEWAVRNVITLFLFMNISLKMHFKNSFALEGIIKIIVRMFHVEQEMLKIDLIKIREVEVFQTCYKVIIY